MSSTRVISRRAFLGAAFAACWLIAYRARHAEEEDPEPSGRFKGIGGAELIVDGVEGPELEGVEFFDDRGIWVYAASVVSKNRKSGEAYPSPHIPDYIRVIWRKNPTPVWGGQAGGITYEGPIAGDYIVPVGSRIPDAVLDDIRAHGGGLRFKFRLKPDGVLFGWDIVRGVPIPGCDPKQNLTCIGTEISSPGGDFLETRY